MKRKNNFKIKITKKSIYSLILLGILILVGGVYAYVNPLTGVGHDIQDIGAPIGCSADQYLSWSGSSWTCVYLFSIPSCSEGEFLQAGTYSFNCLDLRTYSEEVAGAFS